MPIYFYPKIKFLLIYNFILKIKLIKNYFTFENFLKY